MEVTHPTIEIQGLPAAFRGLRIAQVTDVHHGPYLSRKRVARVVEMTNELQPDVIVLTGDYVHRSSKYIGPVWQELSRLQAPLGVYAVLGNHDHWEGAAQSLQAMEAAGITNLTNCGVTLHRGGASMFLAGVADLWEGEPDLKTALAQAGPQEVAIVLCHEPDVFEQQQDTRAKLWLAGHTHGGQVYMPWLFPPIFPSQYGQKYRAGLVQRGEAQIYVSRGIGTVTPPLRFACRPELPVIILEPAPAAPSAPEQ